MQPDDIINTQPNDWDMVQEERFEEAKERPNFPPTKNSVEFEKEDSLYVVDIKMKDSVLSPERRDDANERWNIRSSLQDNNKGVAFELNPTSVHDNVKVIDAFVKADSDDKSVQECVVRASLQRDIRRRRQSLTNRERSFLTNLAVEGDVDDVKKAQAKLGDDGLFFDDKSDEHTINGSERSRNGRMERRGTLSGRILPPKARVNSSSVGSMKRRESLASRRSNASTGGVWKAHEMGLAVSPESSRKSIAARRASVLRESVLRESVLRESGLVTIEVPMDRDSFNASNSSLLSALSASGHAMRGSEHAMRGSIRLSSMARGMDLLTASGGGSDSLSNIQEGHPMSMQEAAAFVTSLYDDLTEASDLNQGEEEDADVLLDKKESLCKVPEDKNEAKIQTPAAVLPPMNRRSVLKRLSYSMTQKPRPVLMRLSSGNSEEEVGVEISGIDDPASPLMLQMDVLESSQMVSNMPTIDERVHGVGCPIKLCYSDDGIGFVRKDDENGGSCASDSELYDAWRSGKQSGLDDTANQLTFHILGTSADDVHSHPHVMSPPLLNRLRSSLPYTVAEDNFWMKYSLVRDGASLHSLLQAIRGSKNTLLAVETVDGEVFGSYTAAPWKRQHGYFGTGQAFLWRLCRSRKASCKSVIDLAVLEGEVEVFNWSNKNYNVQLCRSDIIAVGGGEEVNPDTDQFGFGPAVPSLPAKDMDEPQQGEFGFGFGLAIEEDLLNGTSSSCVTFDSPPLASLHPDGSPFEILNIEVWTMTPCTSVEEAERLDMRMLFLESNRK